MQPITKQQISNTESSHVVAAKLSSAAGVVIEISKLFAMASNVIGLQGAVCSYFQGSTGRLMSIRILCRYDTLKKKLNRELWIVEHSMAGSHGGCITAWINALTGRTNSTIYILFLMFWRECIDADSSFKFLVVRLQIDWCL